MTEFLNPFHSILYLFCSPFRTSPVTLYCCTFATDVNAREWFSCTSLCCNHTVTCQVLPVMWTVDGFSKSLDSHCMRSEKKTAPSRLANAVVTTSATVCVLHLPELLEIQLCYEHFSVDTVSCSEGKDTKRSSWGIRRLNIKVTRACRFGGLVEASLSTP